MNHENPALAPIAPGAQLTTIAESLQPDIISSFWTMLRECENKAQDESPNGLLRLWVEGWYRQWNDMTGDDKGPSWLLKIESPRDREIVDEFRRALNGGPEALLALDDKVKAEAKRTPIEGLDRATSFYRHNLDRVKMLIAEQLGIAVPTVNMEQHFVRDLGADSLDCIEMVMCLEDEFSLEIPEEDMETLQTVKDMVDYVVRARLDRNDC